MIVKTVSKKTTATSNFGSLAAYMLDEKNAGRKVEEYCFTNCSFEEDSHNLLEIANTQALDTRSKSDKTYHMIVSFQEDENPSAEIMQQIEEELVKSIGMDHHQRLSVVHGNTNNLHIHIAINKIDPETHRNVDPSFDKTKLQERAAQLEQQYGLKIDNHTRNKEKVQQRDPGEIHGGIESFKSWVKTEALQPINEALSKAEKWEELHKVLGEYDLEIRERGNGMVIATRSGKLFVKASDVSRDLSKGKLEAKFGAFEKPSQIEPAQKRFGQTSKLKGEYWDEYRQTNEQNKRQKAVLLAKLKQEAATKKLIIITEHQEQRGKIQSNDLITGVEKKEMYRDAMREKRQKLLELYLDTEKQRNEIYAQTRHTSYKDSLILKAIEGDTKALELLRSSKPEKLEIPKDANVVYGENAKPIIKTQDKPMINKNGDIVYKLGNKTKIKDVGSSLKVTELRNESEYLKVLMLAREKFGKALNIHGTDEFKKQITAAAIKYNIDVEFKDRSMEDARLAVTKVIDHAKEQEIEKSKSNGMGL